MRKVIQNVAIQPQQQVVENLIDLDEAKKPEGKFAEFIGDDYKKNPLGFEYPYDVQFKNTGMNQFRCSSLECDNLTSEMILWALERHLYYLQKFIDKKMEVEIENFKNSLKEKYEKEFHCDVIEKKVKILQEKIVLENLGTGKLEEKWNETQPN